MENRKMIAYISGKVTGVEYNNEPLFREWENKLVEMGYEVVVPHDLTPFAENPTWNDWMRVCIAAMMVADVVVTLPDWGQSRGAITEVEVSRRINIPVVPCHNIKPANLMTWPLDAVFQNLSAA